LVFDVIQPVTIDTVFVYPGGPGTLQINILNASNVLLNSVSVSVPGGGRRAIPLGITVYPGTSYRINASGSSVSGLYRNDTSAVYPYVLQNVLSITNTINGNGPLGFYYFFYDWRMSVPGCAGPRTPVTVSVLNSPPGAGFSMVISQTIVNFTDTTSGTAQSWLWDFGDNNTSAAQNPMHSYANPGTYPVCLIASNACGSDTICDSVTVCNPLNPGYFILQSGLNVVFSDTSSGATAWLWNFGDGGTDSTASSTHTYLAEGIYQVCLQVTNLCQQSDSICDSVAVCTPLVADFGFQQQPGNGLDYAFTDQSQGVPTSYFWDFGDGGTSNQANPSHTFTQTGPLTVTLILTNACGQSDTSQQMLTIVGLENEAFSGMRVAPNPSADVFRVSLPEMNAQLVVMRVRDLHGRVVWTGKWSENRMPNEVRIDLGGVAAGIYLLEVEAGEKQARRRLNRL
jgi:PKD repeat protein